MGESDPLAALLDSIAARAGELETFLIVRGEGRLLEQFKLAWSGRPAHVWSRVVSALETAYGYPLDIEFGIEGSRLFVLQARPVATFLSLLRDTMERHPLDVAAAPFAALAVAGELTP